MTSREPLFEIPNLDHLSIDPADYDRAAVVFSAYTSYCRNKAQAMRHRLAGEIGAAMSLETGNSELYQALPKWAQW